MTTIVNVGASVMNINIIRNGASLFTRDIPLGGNKYTEAIQRELGLSFEEAEDLKTGARKRAGTEDSVSMVLDGVNAEVASEIARTVDYYKSTTGEGDVERLLLCGGGAKVHGLVDHLQERMQITVELVNAFGEIDCSGSEVDAAQLTQVETAAAVGVGLALRAMGD